MKISEGVSSLDVLNTKTLKISREGVVSRRRHLKYYQKVSLVGADA